MAAAKPVSKTVGPYLASVLFGSLGLFIAATLSLDHLRGGLPPCGGSDGCGVVADSAYSRVFGVPVAFIGFFGYLLILFSGAMGRRGGRWQTVAASLAGVGAIVSLVLVAVSQLAIHATCLWCLGSAACMITLYLCLRADRWSASLVPLPAFLGFSILGPILAIGGAFASLQYAQAHLVDYQALRNLDPRELDAADAPSLGPPSAKVVIVEFADFACPACKQMFPKLEKLQKSLPGVRLVFRNLPQPNIRGHEASREGALYGLRAQAKGRFWQFAERAYALSGHPTLPDYQSALASTAGEAWNPTGAAQENALLDRDLELARKLKLTTTPAFFVISPDLPVQVSTNIGLDKVLLKPEIGHYLSGVSQ